MKVGVISDTHGVLEPEVESAYRAAGLERILHAGDIGGPEVIRRLSAIAEVTAVAGNADGLPFSDRFPPRQALMLNGCKILLIHDLGHEDHPADEVETWIRLERPRVVVFGHLHRPVMIEREGVLFFNPGSAGLARGRVPRTFGFLHIDGGRPEVAVETLLD